MSERLKRECPRYFKFKIMAIIFYKETFWCRLNAHNWRFGHYITGYRSEFTGDHVGRSEMHCLECNARRITLSQYSKEHQRELLIAAGDDPDRYKKRYPGSIKYVPGDAVDKLSKKWIADSGAIPPKN